MEPHPLTPLPGTDYGYCEDCGLVYDPMPIPADTPVRCGPDRAYTLDLAAWNAMAGV